MTAKNAFFPEETTAKHDAASLPPRQNDRNNSPFRTSSSSSSQSDRNNPDRNSPFRSSSLLTSQSDRNNSPFPSSSTSQNKFLLHQDKSAYHHQQQQQHRPIHLPAFPTTAVLAPQPPPTHKPKDVAVNLYKQRFEHLENVAKSHFQQRSIFPTGSGAGGACGGDGDGLGGRGSVEQPCRPTASISPMTKPSTDSDDRGNE